MNRHLLPDEIDLLLDNEEGFGVAPLREHLQGCASCQASYSSLAAVVGTLERLPHLHPAPLFADRVMRRVEVYQPWHVAARDSLVRLLPRSASGRFALAGTGAAVAAGFTAAVLWVGQRADAVLFVGNYGLQKLRDGSVTLVTEAISSLFGAGAAASVASGDAFAVAGAAGAAVAGVIVAAAGMKAVATASRRRRT